MTWMGFVASVIDSLAWPVASVGLVAFVVLVFREPLRSLISRLRSVSHGREGTRANFDPLPEPKSAMPAGDQLNSAVGHAIANDPRRAILSAWFGLMREANELLDGLGASPRKDAAETINALWQRGLLDTYSYNAMVALKQVNDRLIQEPNVEPDSGFAEDYAAVVGRLVLGSDTVPIENSNDLIGGNALSATQIQTWYGRSGRAYDYVVFPIDSFDFPNAPGNYIFARNNAGVTWTPLYIGQTGVSLRDRIASHHILPSVQHFGGTHVHFRQNDDHQLRSFEEMDLISRWTPACNSPNPSPD